MSDIFISYSSKHRDLTEVLAKALTEAGHSVWWDKELEAYDTFRDQIDAALSAAQVVVVVWSDGAAQSDYVVAEAREALTTGGRGRQGRLVNTFAPGFDPLRIPKPMSEYQAEPVESVDGVMRAIARRWAGERPSRLDAAEFFMRSAKRPVLATKQEELPSAGYVPPSELLHARKRLVGFVDSHGMRSQLIDWAESGESLAGQLVYGPGGLGKTRLLAEVAERLRDAGWSAGFVEEPDERDGDIHRQALDFLIGGKDDKGLLLILDYAERRDKVASGLSAQLLEAASRRPGRPLRIVLLARSTQWWDETLRSDRSLLGVFGPDSTHAMPDFAAGEDRELLLRASLDALTPTITRAGLSPAATPFPEERLEQVRDDPNYSRPLMIQMEALLHLMGDSPPRAGAAALLDGVLGLEEAYWKRTVDDGLAPERVAARLKSIGRGASQSTLLGRIDGRSEIERLLKSDGHYVGERSSSSALDIPIDDLSRVYGDGMAGLLPVEPDLVGEHLVLAKSDDALVDACLEWASDDADRRRAILTVLQRASRGEHGDRASRAADLMERLVKRRSEILADEITAVIFETPGELESILLDALPQLALPSCRALYDAMPERSIRLAPISRSLAERVVELHRHNADDTHSMSELALRLNVLSTRLSDLGRREDALAATSEAVEIYRGLSAKNKDTFGPDLARSLDSLGLKLSALDHVEDALAATHEAVDIWRKLYEKNREAFGSDLADTLHHLAEGLSRARRRDEALAARDEAVEIYRGLCLSDIDAFGPDLAMSLSDLGRELRSLGDLEGALARTREAVEIQRGLYARNGDGSGSGLAAGLTNLGIWLRHLGRREEAVSVLIEALEIYRGRYATNRDAFGPNFAEVLEILAAELSRLGRWEEALAATSDAVEIHRNIFAKNEDAFGPDLAKALNNLGAMLSLLGRREEALAATREAVEMRRALYAKNKDAFGPHLARSLINLGDTQRANGQIEDAVESYIAGAEVLRSPDQTLSGRQKGLLRAARQKLAASWRENGRGEIELRGLITQLGGDPDELLAGAPADVAPSGNYPAPMPTQLSKEIQNGPDREVELNQGSLLPPDGRNAERGSRRRPHQRGSIFGWLVPALLLALIAALAAVVVWGPDYGYTAPREVFEQLRAQLGA